MNVTTLLIYLAILVIVVIFLYWLLTQVTLPDPIGKMVKVALVVIAVVALIWLLLQFAGRGVDVTVGWAGPLHSLAT